MFGFVFELIVQQVKKIFKIFLLNGNNCNTNKDIMAHRHETEKS